MIRNRSFPLFAALAALIVFAGCSDKSREAKSAHHHHHQHVAPHGGTAVILGDEAYHLEFVLNAEAGTLTAYLLDGHLQNFIRTDTPSFEIVATVSGEPRLLQFVANANSATGETVGDTSQFTVQADWLKTTTAFDAELTRLSVRGTPFSAVRFKFPEGHLNAHP